MLQHQTAASIHREQQVPPILKAFGCRVIAYDQYFTDAQNATRLPIAPSPTYDDIY